MRGMIIGFSTLAIAALPTMAIADGLAPSPALLAAQSRAPS